MSQDDDLVVGWRYFATLQLRTPLAYLEMDGKFSAGPKEPPLVGPAENFLEGGASFNPYGMWLREIDYKKLGFDELSSDNETRATGWGQVRSGSESERDLISFLKSFRYIVETAEGLDQKLSELKELSTSTSENRKVWKKLKKADPLFPDSFFSSALESLPGVGSSMAQKLFKAGFRTVEEVQTASDGELLAVPGLGKGLLAKIRVLNPAVRPA